MSGREPAPIDRIASRLIAMAARLCGGDMEKVRQRMGCSSSDFDDYLAARKTPSNPEFDRVVALIIEEQDKIIEKNRAVLAAMRAKRP